MSKWETLGHIGVDSGTIMVVDPCYVVPDDDWMNWYYEYRDKNGFDNWFAHMDSDGIAVTTPHGDGVYPVEARRNKNGQIVEIRILLGWDDE